MFRFLPKNKISQLPKKPGVYAFKKGNEILYIGKATNIKERVKNHLQQPRFKENLWVGRAKKIGYSETASEIEALILESNLIKKYQPKYNVVWRDDKNYFYVGITEENYPRVFITHQPKVNSQRSLVKSQFIGPFVDGKALKQTLKILRKVFPYRSCKTIPKHPCLWYQLNRCPAPCQINLKTQISSKKKSTEPKNLKSLRLKIERESQENAKNLAKVLQGKKGQVLKNLKKEMKKAAILQNFERAAKIRDQIKALEKVLSHAKILELFHPPSKNWLQIQKNLKELLRTKVKVSRIEGYDVSNIQGKMATGSLVVFINGKPNKNFYRKFKIKITGKPNDVAMIKETLERRLKHLEWPYPNLILVDGGKAQLNAARSTINKHRLTIPVMALAKRKNELYIENQKKPILLRNLPKETSNLILQTRDEAHRFAITYHRKLREIAFDFL